MFDRINWLWAAFERKEFDEAGLALRLERLVADRAQEQRPSCNQTQVGLAPVRVQP